MNWFAVVHIVPTAVASLFLWTSGNRTQSVAIWPVAYVAAHMIGLPLVSTMMALMFVRVTVPSVRPAPWHRTTTIPPAEE